MTWLSILTSRAFIFAMMGIAACVASFALGEHLSNQKWTATVSDMKTQAATEKAQIATANLAKEQQLQKQANDAATNYQQYKEQADATTQALSSRLKKADSVIEAYSAVCTLTDDGLSIVHDANHAVSKAGSASLMPGDMSNHP